MERVTCNVIQGLSELSGEKKGSMYVPGSMLCTDSNRLRTELMDQAANLVRKNPEYEPLLRSMQGLLEVIVYERIIPSHSIGVFFSRCSFEFIEIPQSMKPSVVFSDQYFILPLLGFQGVSSSKEKFLVAQDNQFDLYQGDLFGFEEVEHDVEPVAYDRRVKSDHIVKVNTGAIGPRGFGKVPQQVMKSLTQKIRCLYEQRLDGTKEFLKLKREDLLYYPQGNEPRPNCSLANKPVLYLSDALWWTSSGSAPGASTAFLSRSFNRFICATLAQGGQIKSVPAKLFPANKNFAERCQQVSKVEALVPQKKAS